MIGQRIGRYRITASLPASRIGSVWLAEDELLGRTVRLEVIPVEAPDVAARFAREARLASQLPHAAIATVYDAGTADGFHYIARQSIAAPTVRDRAVAGIPIDIGEAVRAASDLAAALQHLHEHDLVHGEVEAGSAWILPEGRALLDGFGRATPADADAVALRAEDLRGLGTILDELTRHQRSQDVAEVVRDLGDSRATRLEDTARFAARLQELAARLVTPGPPDTTIVRERRRSLSRIRRLAVALAMSLGVALAAILIARLNAKPSVPSVAVLPFAIAGDDSSATDPLADGIGEQLVTKLSQLASMRVTPWVSVMRYADSERSPTDLAQELGVAQLVIGSYDGTGDSVRVAVRLVDGATGADRWARQFRGPRAAILDLQRDVAVDVARELRVRLTREQRRALRRNASTNPEAWELYLRGAQEMQTEERPAYRQALALFNQALALDPDLAEAYVGIGAVWTASNYMCWEPTEPALREAEANFRRALALKPRFAAAYRGLIRVHFNRGEDEKCLQIGQEVAGLGMDDVQGLITRADAYYFGALPDEAVVLYRRALALDPVNAGAIEFLVTALTWCGQYEEAVRLGENFLERFGTSHNVIIWLRLSHMCLGNVERARELNGVLQWGASDESWLPTDMFKALGEGEKRVAFLKGRARILGPMGDRPANVFALRYLGVGEANYGDLPAAERWERLLTEVAPSNGNTPAFRAMIREAMGDIDGAVDLDRETIRRGNLLNVTGVGTDCHGMPSRLAAAKNYGRMVEEYEEAFRRRRAQYGSQTLDGVGVRPFFSRTDL